MSNIDDVPRFGGKPARGTDVVFHVTVGHKVVIGVATNEQKMFEIFDYREKNFTLLGGGVVVVVAGAKISK